MAERDPDAVQRFVEQFASALMAAGLLRMQSRVIAALACTDSGRLTAAELAEALQVSPAAISGAVRYLVQYDLIRREREPGSRRDHYVVDLDSWYDAIANTDRVMLRWQASAREGMEVLGADTPAGERMAEYLAFFEFLNEELSGIQDKWKRLRAERRS